MGKDKKKKSKKDKPSEDVLDTAALSIKKFRKVTRQIGKLSTGQKLVGGLALAAAGLVYLATRDTDEAPAVSATKVVDSSDGDDPVPPHKPASARHHRKGPKSHSD